MKMVAGRSLGATDEAKLPDVNKKSMIIHLWHYNSLYITVTRTNGRHKSGCICIKLMETLKSTRIWPTVNIDSKSLGL